MLPDPAGPTTAGWDFQKETTTSTCLSLKAFSGEPGTSAFSLMRPLRAHSKGPRHQVQLCNPFSRVKFTGRQRLVNSTSLQEVCQSAGGVPGITRCSPPLELALCPSSPILFRKTPFLDSEDISPRSSSKADRYLSSPQLWGPQVCSGVPGVQHPGWCTLLSLISILLAEERNRTPSSLETNGQSPPNCKPRLHPRWCLSCWGATTPMLKGLMKEKQQYDYST